MAKRFETWLRLMKSFDLAGICEDGAILKKDVARFNVISVVTPLLSFGDERKGSVQNPIRHPIHNIHDEGHLHQFSSFPFVFHGDSIKIGADYTGK